MPQVVQIIKYPNRRFYSKQDSRYVTLQDLLNLVRDQFGIHVVERATGNDITASVLLLMIQLDPHPSLTPDVLHRILRAGAQYQIKVEKTAE